MIIKKEYAAHVIKIILLISFLSQIMEKHKRGFRLAQPQFKFIHFKKLICGFLKNFYKSD